MANAWFRMYSEFTTDPKVQMMTETNQRRLVMLLCLRCNNSVTLHDEEVAFQLRILIDDWLMTKSMFIDKGFIDTSNNIINWDKRQFVSDSSTERVAKHRASKKRYSNTCNTSSDTDTDTDTDTDIKIKDKDVEKVEVVTKLKAANINFKKPTLQEIAEFCHSKNYNIDPETFFAHYESNGWVVGQAKARMKCWKSALVTWGKRDQNNRANGNETNYTNRSGSTGGISNNTKIARLFDQHLDESVAASMGGCHF